MFVLDGNHSRHFLEDMGEIPHPGWTLNRINNDGNYEPGNCNWADAQEQANNRTTNKATSLELEL